MIPKIIHYIWLGGKPLPKIAEKCIKSWQRYCPDYKIKRWDESNLDLDKYQFARDADDAKKFAFASDVLRTDILYQYGGIYLDIDVELLKNIDEFLKYKIFMGFETSDLLNPGLLIGCEPFTFELKDILNIYQNLKFDVQKCKKLTICEVYTDYFKEKQGLFPENSTQILDQNAFFSSEYFSPIDVITSKKKITRNTYSIHWYNASWYTPKQKMLKFLKKLANLITFGYAGRCYQNIKKQKELE